MNNDPLTMEAIYYAGPIPASAAALTVAGIVFDRLIFPGVHLPLAGFDQAGLDTEIKRIAGLPGKRSLETQELLEIMNFVQHAKTLQGLCVFEEDDPFGSVRELPREFVMDIFTAIHGPLREGWQPMFDTRHSKALPGGDEYIGYPGAYHYLGNAIVQSGKRRIPLLNDMPGLPIPGLENASPLDNARLLSGILAIECTKLSLPTMPVLQPAQLMEFREENKAALRAFRRSMLQYAADFNDKIAGLDPEEIRTKTKFFVETEVAPALDELRVAMNTPPKSWARTALDTVRVVPKIAAAMFTMEPNAALAAALLTCADQYFAELQKGANSKDKIKRSGLYYLLQLEKLGSNKSA